MVVTCPLYVFYARAFLIETMALMSELNLSQDAVRRQVGSAIDLLVHTERTPSGRRIVSNVVTVACTDKGEYELESMFATNKARSRER